MSLQPQTSNHFLCVLKEMGCDLNLWPEITEEVPFVDSPISHRKFSFRVFVVVVVVNQAQWLLLP